MVGSSKCDWDVKRSRRGGWDGNGSGCDGRTRQAKNLQVVVVSFAWGRGVASRRRPPLCARNRSFPSSAVLIVKDVDVVVFVVRIATVGAFKGVEGINGPSVRGRPHLDHAARYRDQAGSP